MRILVAPQEFKGSLTAVEAASAIAEGLREALPDAEVIEAPMSDGGPGLLDAMLAALGGRRVEARVADPLKRPIRAEFGLLPDGTAVIEMAAASGLVLLSPHERMPLATTTYGTGELIRAALEHAPREIIIGVGGSATIDGGAGAISALGVRLLDSGGRELTHGGADLARLEAINVSGLDKRLRTTPLRFACDVTNPLVGEEGAAAVYGPQKGALPDEVPLLDAALQHFAGALRRDFGVDVASMRGAGAAGGLPAALVAIAGATIEPGFDLVAEVTQLADKVMATDVVITGEGRLDKQTAYGKTASGVAELAHKYGAPVGAIVGYVEDGYVANGTFDEIEELRSPGMSTEEAMASGATLLRAAAARMIIRMSD